MTRPVTDAPIMEHFDAVNVCATEIVHVERSAPGLVTVTFAARRSVFLGSTPHAERHIMLRLTVPEVSLRLMGRQLLEDPQTTAHDPDEVPAHRLDS